HQQAVRGTGHHGEFGVGQAPVRLDGVLQADLVVVGHHDQRATGDGAQVGTRERGLAAVHGGQLGDDHAVVADPVGGQLAVAAFQEVRWLAVHYPLGPAIVV